MAPYSFELRAHSLGFALSFAVALGAAGLLQTTAGQAATPDQQGMSANAPATGSVLTPNGAGNDRLISEVDRAVEHYAQGEFQSAEKVLSDLVEEHDLPDDIRRLVLFNRGAARLQLARFEGAVEDFDAAEQLAFPNPGQLHLARGLAWEYLDQPGKAADDFVDAFRADPTDPMIKAKVRLFFNKP